MGGCGGEATFESRQKSGVNSHWRELTRVISLLNGGSGGKERLGGVGVRQRQSIARKGTAW